MPDKPLNERVDEAIDNLVSDAIFGKNEDLFVRSARRKNAQKVFGKGLKYWTVTMVPGVYAYCAIKDHIKNPKFDLKQKIMYSTIDLGFELAFDVYRVGLLYGLYKFDQMLRNTH